MEVGKQFYLLKSIYQLLFHSHFIHSSFTEVLLYVKCYAQGCDTLRNKIRHQSLKVHSLARETDIGTDIIACCPRIVTKTPIWKWQAQRTLLLKKRHRGVRQLPLGLPRRLQNFLPWPWCQAKVKGKGVGGGSLHRSLEFLELLASGSTVLMLRWHCLSPRGSTRDYFSLPNFE